MGVARVGGQRGNTLCARPTSADPLKAFAKYGVQRSQYYGPHCDALAANVSMLMRVALNMFMPVRRADIAAAVLPGAKRAMSCTVRLRS